MLARTGGASDEHRLRGEKAPGFQHAVRSFVRRDVCWSFVVGRE